MKLISELLSQDLELSPECRFLSLALHLDLIRTPNLVVDISASRLKNDFGVSHKTTQTVIELFKEKGRGSVGSSIKRERQSAFFKVVVIIRLFTKQLLFLDLGECHQQVHSF
ncbi:hypothetical protein VAT7223_01886 [Vibrio atlanticus]|uniref:Uncharacterized protein n=1 Tax=Vibrio atlanticus TaxID=693153 RepID=A0A1C3IR51_9VIBR|nr:hypothetical protein [Vibrio atlanticus]SBS63892.1 hypothetical protein VAT7223_01886 [Vibrio atlanticus]